MKVLFATNHAYLPQRVGGSESSTHELCLTLAEHGVEVSVLSGLMPWRPIEGKSHYLMSVRWGGSTLRDDLLGYPVFRARKPALAVPELVRSLQPDIVVIQAGLPLTLLEPFTALKAPTIVYLRDAFFDQLGGAVRERSGVLYAATSRDLSRRFETAYGIVPRCIFPIVRAESYRVESRRKNVTFVCPFPVKGLEIALSLAELRPDIPFLFIESWPLDLVRRGRLWWRLRAANNITLRSPTLDMRSVYRDTKMMLVPSRCPEAWGRVVSEAQTSSIPILASNYGGLPESVGEGGILVDPDSTIEVWASALSRMWDDPAEYQRLAALAGQHALRPEFQPSTILSELLELFSEVRQHSAGRAPFQDRWKSTTTAGSSGSRLFS